MQDEPEQIERPRWQQEFTPGETETALEAFDRRTFLKLMGASLALAGTGLGGCTRPQAAEKIVPYAASPEGEIPGIARFYASSLPTGPAGAGGGWVAGFGRGVVVEQHEGRPTKIEGNPQHPSSLGATDIFMQAAVLQMYDPDRSAGCLRIRADDRAGPLHPQGITWGAVLGELRSFIQARGEAAGGAGRNGAAALRVRLLSGGITSPTLRRQIQELHGLFPNLRWHVHEVVDGAAAREAQRRVFGRAVLPVYDFSAATRIVSLDGAFLAELPGSLRYAREFAQQRRIAFAPLGPNGTHRDGAYAPRRPDAAGMARLYMAESTISYTGGMADHRVAVKPSVMPAIAQALAAAIAGQAGGAGGGLSAEVARWVAAAAADVRGQSATSVVLAGPYLPAEFQALAYGAHQALGTGGAGGAGTGKTVRYIEPLDDVPEALAGGDASLEALGKALDAGEVDLLIILEVNPAFTAPADLHFAQRLEKFSRGAGHLALHMGGYVDETAALCGLHVPLSHPLEAWGDLRGHDGTAGIVQPLIYPLYATRSAVELFSALAALGIEGGPATPPATGPGGATLEAPAASAADLFSSGYEQVRRTWIEQWKDQSPKDGERRWRQALRDGVIEQTAAPALALNATADMPALLAAAAALPAAHEGIDLTLRPDPAIADGSWANHPWLRELPKPLSRVTWENVALIGPKTAARLGMPTVDHESRDAVPVVRITANGTTIELPAWVQPGHPEEAITLHLGFGRRSAGSVQQSRSATGVDIYPLKTGAAWWIAGGEKGERQVTIERLERGAKVACTQPTQVMQDRPMARQRGIAEIPPAGGTSDVPDLSSTTIASTGKKVHLSLYDENPYAGYKWGMVIDLAACIGCQACVIACQAENNIPVVGKEQVIRGREMHWIRIDTYYGPEHALRMDEALAATAGSPVISYQPMLCQHCENAPCEVVCPVEATSHSSEGINEMTYNRCVGTRYCSNNCPYKVRRFNFYLYNTHNQATINMQRNPNVTVRSRGVMEKCTYCIQRINAARIDAKRQWGRSATDPLVKLPEMRTPAPSDEFATPEKLPRLRVQTACQQACPTQAIFFGDLNDADALAMRLKADAAFTPVNYGVLTELNTQPRTSYLERLTNPNPALAAGAATRPGNAGGGAA